MALHLVATTPPTYGTNEVMAIFEGEFDAMALARLDEESVIWPSYYYSAASPTKLQEAQTNDQGERLRPAHAPRRYTYQDLVWIALFCNVRKKVRDQGIANGSKRAGEIIQQIRRLVGNIGPSCSRIVFFAKRAYLLTDDGRLEALNMGGQVAMAAVVLGSLDGEVRGRIDLLSAQPESSTSTGPQSTRAESSRG